GTFVLHKQLQTIKEKVETLGEASFSQLVYSRDLYQLTETFYEEHPELDGRQSKGHRFDLGTTVFSLFPEVFMDEMPADEGYALVVGRENDTRIAKWIKKQYLKLPDNFEKYKVAFPVANGSGKFGEPLSDPFVCAPFCAQNTTFLSAGRFESLYEAQA
ncbi:type II restriction endonuclease, partial [gut metagenome]